MYDTIRKIEDTTFEFKGKKLTAKARLVELCWGAEMEVTFYQDGQAIKTITEPMGVEGIIEIFKSSYGYLVEE